MRTTWVLRFSGLCFLVGGAGLVALFVSQGACLGDKCNSRPLPGTEAGQVPGGLTTLIFLVAAGVGLFVGAGRTMPVRKAGVAVAFCAAGGAIFATAAGIAAERTDGETWLMPVLVFPALLLLTVAGVVFGVVVRRAELVPRWITVALIVAASLLPLYQQQTPGNFIPALLGLAWVVLGTHLVARGGRAAAHLKQPRPRVVGR
jgi:hypothetical protein